jgi:signal transduction histidine kinase
VRPVKILAEATERVSRGEWIAPLTLSGPKEARDLTHAFNVMQARIARHVESRTRMFAALSHDLNTPITEVRLQLELLEDTPLREDLLESLGELQAMVGATLDFMRGDVQHEPMASASLDGLLKDLARRYRTLGAPVDWHIQDRLECHCRPLALKRALTNLIDNALRHAGDAVVRLEQQADGSARIDILDHGKGIATARLDHVFEPFVQLNKNPTSGDAAKAGLGLGLTIARSCIQAHGGELWLENRPPAGLCAVIVLPAAMQTSA